MRSMPEAVTFDFHNTIARCDQWFQLEVHNLVAEFLRWHIRHNGTDALQVNHDEAVAAYRRIRREIIVHGLEKDACTCVELAALELGYNLDEQHISLGVEAIMRSTLPDSHATDGVVEAIKQLRADGIRLGVVSSAVYHPFLEWSLEKFGILGDFEVIITSASCGYYKSRTEIYTQTVEALGAAPEHTVHIGDSVTYDIDTASRIGMGTVLYDPEGVSESPGNAGAVVRTMMDIHRVIERVYQEMHG